MVIRCWIRMETSGHADDAICAIRQVAHYFGMRTTVSFNFHLVEQK